ncbi:MAG: sugar transferase [Actinomycetota bacterium]|nr:sugar transferase [Actinomycetota bacterium]
MSVVEPTIDLRRLERASTTGSSSAVDLEVLSAGSAPWLRRYSRALILLDTGVLVLAGLAGGLVRFGFTAPDREVRGVNYLVGSLLLLPVWIATLALCRCYEERFLGNGSEEFRRVADASFRVAAVAVFLLFITKTDISRGFLSVALIGGLVGVVAGRYTARLWLHRQRRRGRCVHNVVVVGDAAHALEMTATLARHPFAGLLVVGACITGDVGDFQRESSVPVQGSVQDLLPALERLQADSVVVAKGPGMTTEDLRHLSYALEGTGVDLYVPPSLTNVTGSRISFQALPGLPLLHVEEPELSGSRRLVKGAFDRVFGLLLLVLAAPLLVVCWLAVRLTSRGPAIFRQERIGQSGGTFRIWKFRTMSWDAEARKSQLADRSAHSVYFKVQDDPRITRMGRFLRRYSLDELPQLINVVRGEMSLVGPRPQVQSEVDAYEGHVGRRLLVKPGMTGLWQVSGRNDLDFEEAVRLDLYYVENWSLGLDVAVLCRTLLAVLKPRGAY